MNSTPLVSILIPTHNRPDYFELALKSAMTQTYRNIEIVISDNGDNDITRDRLAPYLNGQCKIKYSRSPGLDALQNGHNCYRLAEGEYINYLMDDDLFHPQKIERMVPYLVSMSNVGVVTSVRQLIDANGAHLSAVPPFEKVFNTETLIAGRSLGVEMLTKSGSIIGEPTTALFRRSCLSGMFGEYCNRQYITLSDIASWLAILENYDCVYLPDTLSYFRIHTGQDQRQKSTQFRGAIENLNLLCDSYLNNKFLPKNPPTHNHIAFTLSNFILKLTAIRDDLHLFGFQKNEISDVINRATGVLLGL